MIVLIDGKLIKINEFKSEQDRLGIGLYRYSWTCVGFYRDSQVKKMKYWNEKKKKKTSSF